MPTPIVLIHGLFGFDQLRLAGFAVADYFREIPRLLREDGHIVPDPPALSPGGSIAERAADLQRYLESNESVAGRAVHLIAHSMGGLDARFMIAHLGMAARVVSLTTIGTPHRGSPLADLLTAAALPAGDQLLAQLGVSLRGMKDLTTAACARFNDETPEVESVRYFSVGGFFEPPRIAGVPFGFLSATHDLIQRQAGENDGMVSTSSARFGQREDRWTALEAWPVNHFRQINWGENLLPTPAELTDSSIARRYLELARQLETLSV